LLLFPIVFGPVAVILGVIAWAKGEKLGPVAFAAAILGTIVGMVLGYVIWSGIS
jgi:flagellar motor component MotA